MSSRAKAKQAVYLVLTPPEFRPTSLWDVAPSFLSGELYAKNLTMDAAHYTARTFNKVAMEHRQRHDWDHRWAIVSKHLKARNYGKHPLASTQVGKGGAL